MSEDRGWLAKVEVDEELILFLKCENRGDVLQVEKEREYMSKRDT